MSSAEMTGGFVQQAGEGQQLFAMGSLVTIVVPSAATGGQFTVIEHVVPPAGGPPPHTHSAIEYLYVLEGVFDAWVGDLSTPVRALAGATIFVPAGTPHTTRNVGATAGRLISTYAPGGDEGFFQAIGVPASELPQTPDMGRPADMSGIDPARVKALAERFGMRLVS